MSDNYVERVAGEIADLALADEERSGDEKIVQQIGNILGSSSQTLEEAFLTAVRVRRAETRARELLAERAGKTGRVKSRLISDAKTTAETKQEAAEEATASEATQEPEPPQSAEDAAFADVLNTLDEFLQTDDDADDAVMPGVTPSKPTRR